MDDEDAALWGQYTEPPVDDDSANDRATYKRLTASKAGRKNKGKKYKRDKVPEKAEGTWFASFTDETWTELLARKSYVLIGVMRSIVKRARSSGIAKGVDRNEVAAEVGCSVTAVSKAYVVLASIKVKESDGDSQPLLKKLYGGHQGLCSTFEVHGYRRGKE